MDVQYLQFLQTVFNGLLAVLTLGLVIVGAWQARRLRESVEVTRISADAARKSADAATENVQLATKALSIQQRPWVVPTGQVDIEFNPESPDWYRVNLTVHLINTGHGPARRVSIRANYSISDWADPPPGTRDYGNTAAVHTIGAIGPGLPYKHYWETKIDKTGYDAVRTQNKSRFVVCCFVEYLDTLGDSHTTTICLRQYGPNGKPPFIIDGPYNECT